MWHIRHMNVPNIGAYATNCGIWLICAKSAGKGNTNVFESSSNTRSHVFTATRPKTLVFKVDPQETTEKN